MGPASEMPWRAGSARKASRSRSSPADAYSARAADLTTASTEELRALFDVSVLGLVTGVQEALPDLKKQKGEEARRM